MCRAGSGVSVFSLHPGVVQSDLWRHQHQCIQVAVKIFKIFTKTTVEGAQTTIYCAVEPNLEHQSGGYFRYGEHCGPVSLVVQPYKTLFLSHRTFAQHLTTTVSPSLCVHAQRLCPRELLEDGLWRQPGWETVGDQLQHAGHHLAVTRGDT